MAVKGRLSVYQFQHFTCRGTFITTDRLAHSLVDEGKEMWEKPLCLQTSGRLTCKIIRNGLPSPGFQVEVRTFEE